MVFIKRLPCLLTPVFKSVIVVSAVITIVIRVVARVVLLSVSVVARIISPAVVVAAWIVVVISGCTVGSSSRQRERLIVAQDPSIRTVANVAVSEFMLRKATEIKK